MSYATAQKFGIISMDRINNKLAKQAQTKSENEDQRFRNAADMITRYPKVRE